MPRPPTIVTKSKLWLSELESNNYPETTLEIYDCSVQSAIRFGAGHGWPEDPRKLEGKHIREWLEHLRLMYSTGTQRTYGTNFLIFLKWCKNMNLERFRLKVHVERSRVDWLTVEEAAAVLASAPSLNVKTMEICLIYLGVRADELRTLKLADMHPDHIMIQGKGCKGRRIPVRKEFWAAISEYMAWRRKYPGQVFMVYKKGEEVRPYAHGGIFQAMQPHARMLGRHLSPHTFRRSFGRHLYKAGMPLPDIQRLYGHSSLEMTIRYLGINDEDTASGLDRFQPDYR